MTRYRIKKVDSVFRSHMIDMLVFGVPFAALVIGGVGGYIPDEWFFPTWVAGAIIALIALFRQVRRFKYLSCPECQMRLVVDEVEEGESISFTCEECKVVWRTDFIHSTD